mgnify:CR=1 FL=1
MTYKRTYLLLGRLYIDFPPFSKSWRITKVNVYKSGISYFKPHGKEIHKGNERTIVSVAIACNDPFSVSIARTAS